MSGYYLLKKGEFAYNKSYSVGYDYGSIKRLDNYKHGALSTLYICFSLNKFNSDFMKVYFDSLKWYKEIYMIAAEGARNHGLLNVPTNDFFNTTHYLPVNIQEQEKIASFLLLLEKRIQLQKQLIENLKLYKRGLINTLFDDNEWSEICLKNILKERKTYCEKDGSYVHATLSKEGVSAKTERYNRDFLVSNDNKKYKITKYNDLCYNPANLKFGVICLNKFGNAIFSPIYVTFEINSSYNPDFIGLSLTRNSFINKALKYQQGTVYERMAVSPEDLLTMKIQIPEFNKQVKISKFLNTLSNKIINESNQLENLITLKKSLLQQMFI